MSAQKTRLRTGVLRPLLAAHTVLFVCLTLFTYFLYDASFYTGSETLTQEITDHLVQHECENATAWLFAIQRNDMDKISEYAEHFNRENSNFFFSFSKNPKKTTDEEMPENPDPESGSATILYNYRSEDFYVSYPDYPISSIVSAVVNAETAAEGNKKTDEEKQILEEEKISFFRRLPDLTLSAFVHTPLTAKDDFYRAQQLVHVLDRLKYPALLLLALSALLNGRLWIMLCKQASRKQVSASMLELDDAPFYLLLLFWLFGTSTAGYFLKKNLLILYNRAIFAVLNDVRSAVYITILLLFLIAFLTTLPVTSLCSRMTNPRWYSRFVLYRAFNTSSIEQRLQMWLTVLITLEYSIFLLLFLVFSIDNGKLLVGIDAAFTVVILLITFIQSRGISAYMRATHRIALEGHGTIPTGDLHGKSLEHVQNINFLSRSAGEQMQLRFVNEAFGTKLIRNVSQTLRDPLTAVTAEAERLQSGTLTAGETRQSIAQINDLSQELKQAIEDLLRIANASAEGNEPQCVPTDTTMMLAQAVGEFYDLFRQNQIELVQLTADEPLTVSADGTFMWTVFESVMQEFLQYAVPGTRVFLQADADNDTVCLRIRGTVREDTLPARRSLSLPTAKIFTEKQGGTYCDALENDTLTVELRFAKAETPAEQE